MASPARRPAPPAVDGDAGGQTLARLGQGAQGGRVEQPGMHGVDTLHGAGLVQLQAQHQAVRQQGLQLALGPQEKLTQVAHAHRRFDRTEQVFLFAGTEEDGRVGLAWCDFRPGQATLCQRGAIRASQTKR